MRVIIPPVVGSFERSATGAWIATTRLGVGIELVRISDGLRLPIGGTRTVAQVAWWPQ